MQFHQYVLVVMRSSCSSFGLKFSTMAEWRIKINSAMVENLTQMAAWRN